MAKTNNLKKILIIEDEPNIADIYQTVFSKKGYNALIAEDGKKGYDMANSEKPEAILLDILLPKVNGFELLKKFKTEKGTKDIPVVVLTNLGHEQDKEEAIKLGASGYLVKALFTPEQIFRQVIELI